MIRLVASQDTPNPQVVDPDGNTWVWDADLRTLRNLSADAPESSKQVLHNFEVQWAAFGVTVFADGAVLTRFACPTMLDVRQVLRTVILSLLGPPGTTMFVQYQVWDIVNERWLDPTVEPPAPAASPDGMHNAEVKVGGGMGDRV